MISQPWFPFSLLSTTITVIINYSDSIVELTVRTDWFIVLVSAMKPRKCDRIGF